MRPLRCYSPTLLSQRFAGLVEDPPLLAPGACRGLNVHRFDGRRALRVTTPRGVGWGSLSSQCCLSCRYSIQRDSHTDRTPTRAPSSTNHYLARPTKSQHAKRTYHLTHTHPNLRRTATRTATKGEARCNILPAHTAASLPCICHGQSQLFAHAAANLP